MSEHGYCDKCGEDLGDHPTVNVEGINTLALCQDRAIKWKRVEPGTVIPAGQPYRVEYGDGTAHEWMRGTDCLVDAGCVSHGRTEQWFVDSSWKPPLVLPTAPGSVVKATRGNKRRLWMRGGLNSWIGENGEGPASDSDLLDVRVLFDAESER